jgi:hypothetical protein
MKFFADKFFDMLFTRFFLRESVFSLKKESIFEVEIIYIWKIIFIRKNMEATVDDETRNKIRYLNFIIFSFARGFKMLVPEAFQYLDKYGGLDFLNDHYEYEHTQSEHNTCMTLYRVCRKNGGWLT